MRFCGGSCRSADWVSREMPSLSTIDVFGAVCVAVALLSCSHRIAVQASSR